MIELASASKSTVALRVVQFIISFLFLNIDWLCFNVALSISIAAGSSRGGSCSCHGRYHISRISVNDVAGRLVDHEVSVL